MAGPLHEWVRPLVVIDGGRDNTARLDELQLVFELDPPLLDDYDQSRYGDLYQRMQFDDELFLDVIDYLLGTYAGWRSRAGLDKILVLGGSVWESHSAPPESFGQLQRRVLGPVKESLEALKADSLRAHDHLALAWSKLMGRNPDPSSAYREAVRAVEVTSKPIVAPNDAKYTLGRAIGQLKANSDKWSFVLEGASPAQLADMAGLVWTGQLDRHGTDDESVPLLVSQEQADAAFHICLTLCRMFSGGLISRA